MFENLFEIEGSIVHYSPELSFTIDKIWLEIEPDFKSRSLKGKEQIRITARKDLDSVELDCAQLNIESIYSSSAVALVLMQEQVTLV